jgi:hypothetical protein
MAYGFQVSTSTGQQSTFGLNTARVVKLLDISTVTGSAVVNEFDESKGEFFAYHVIGASFLQLFSWDQSTQTMTWFKHSSLVPNGAYSTSIQVAFIHDK